MKREDDLSPPAPRSTPHDSAIRMRGRTTIRGPWHEVTPDEPPGVYKHVVDGTPCLCKPVVMGNVVLHRPFAECKFQSAPDSSGEPHRTKDRRRIPGR
ncbi:MAG: hypothetical protein ACXVBB_01170 [Isosphaeraceae bacterium]